MPNMWVHNYFNATIGCKHYHMFKSDRNIGIHILEHTVVNVYTLEQTFIYIN